MKAKKKIAVQFQVGSVSGECARMDSEKSTPFPVPTPFTMMGILLFFHTIQKKKSGGKKSRGEKRVIFRYEIEGGGEGCLGWP